jgi:hypothetical protein
MHATPTNNTRIAEGFWLLREQQRYRFIAGKLREAGVFPYADLCDGWAEQARLEYAALDAGLVESTASGRSR